MGVSARQVDAALGVFDNLVSDPDEYVGKSCGGFALSYVAAKGPELRERIEQWEDRDEFRSLL